MKKLTFLFIMLLTSVLGHGQATDLVINNQTPGWLSSKINYSDQQTVRNLKVTGYININDLLFIGTLISERNLNGELDLSESNIVGETSEEDNKLVSLGGNGTLKKYRIPKSVTSVSNCLLGISVDSLWCECNVKYVKQEMFGKMPTTLIVGNAIDSIPDRAFFQYSDNRKKVDGLESVILKGEVRYIGDRAFPYIKNINFRQFEKLRYLGRNAFSYSAPLEGDHLGYFTPDTIIVPKSLNDIYYLFSFSVRDGQHIFIDKNINKVSGITWYGTGGADGKSFTSASLHIHFNNLTPPSLIDYSGLSSRGNGFESSTIYVPKGTKQAYLKSSWNKATIVEMNPVEVVALSEHQVIMNKEDHFFLSVTITPIDADDKNITWSSEDESIATVNNNGMVTAISEGETKIYATSTATGIQDSCNVIVRKNVTSVVINEEQIVFSDIADTKQLVAIIMPNDATEKCVTWKSSNEQVCAVSETGLVTATGVGSAVVTVTTVDGGLTAACIVKVLQHVENVSLEKGELTLQVGDTGLLRANVMPTSADDKTLQWSSSNVKVSTVDGSGNVTALTPGEIWIKAVSKDNPEAKDSCKVTVVQPVLGITVSQSNCTLNNIGERIQLEATVFPEDASNKKINWSSSNTSVCVVSNGLVVATGFGTAMVIATTEDGNQMAFCSVIVKEETEECSFTIKQIESGSVSTKVKKGSPFTVTFNVEEGWKIHSVSLNNEDCTDQISMDYTFTIEKVMNDCLLSVVYEQSRSAMKSVRASDVKIYGTAVGARVTDVPEGTAILVYSEDGVLLKSLMANGSQTDIPLTAGGIYIIKVEEKIVKLKH